MLQKKVISEMNNLCNLGSFDPWTINRVAMHVSGEDNPDGVRRAPGALVTISTSQVKRYYVHWRILCFLVIPRFLIFVMLLKTRQLNGIQKH